MEAIDSFIESDGYYVTNNNRKLIEWKRQIAEQYDVYDISFSPMPAVYEIERVYVNKQSKIVEARRFYGKSIEAGDFGLFDPDAWQYCQIITRPFPELSLYEYYGEKK